MKPVPYMIALFPLFTVVRELSKLYIAYRQVLSITAFLPLSWKSCVPSGCKSLYFGVFL